jgi:hypothetical protein
MKAKSSSAPVESWVKIPRDLLLSDAWRSQSINGRRLIDFLLVEHMKKAGRQNGKLKAPYCQLYEFGIGEHYVTASIREAETLGLVACERHGLRAANTYTLTWLPGHDGTPASDYWKAYRNPSLRPFAAPKVRNLPAKEQVDIPANQQVDGRNLPANQQADEPKSLPPNQQVPSRKILPGSRTYLGRGECESGPPPGTARANPAVPYPGKLRLVGSDHS